MNQEGSELTEDLVVEKKPAIKLVLNGGKSELDDATVPVRWYLSPEAIEQNPQYLIFFEQNQREVDRVFDRNNGRRYICKVSEAVHFLQILSPGHHRVMVVALKDKYRKLAVEVVRDFLSADEGGLYRCDLNWDTHNPLEHHIGSFVASCIVEFDVPAELFAKKPETRFGKIAWKWVNWLHRTEPRDECEFRKRAIISIPKIPVGLFVLAVLAIVYAVVGAYRGICYAWTGITRTAHALYVLVASLVFLFIGFRPRPIIKEMKNAMMGRRRWKDRINLFYRPLFNYVCDKCEIPAGYSIYRLWSVESQAEGAVKLIYIPVTPLYVVLAGWLVYLLWSGSAAVVSSGPDFSPKRIFIGLALGLATVTVAFFVTHILKKTAPARAVAREARREAESKKKRERKIQIAAARREKEICEKEFEAARLKERKAWLSENLGLDNAKPAVDLNEIPVPPDLRDRVVQKFHVSFWRAKAAVCKPFAH